MTNFVCACCQKRLHSIECVVYKRLGSERCLQVNIEINFSRHTRSLCRTHASPFRNFFGRNLFFLTVAVWLSFLFHLSDSFAHFWFHCSFEPSVSIVMQTKMKFVGALGFTQNHTHTHTYINDKGTTKNIYIVVFMHIHMF